jgi:putative tryptophan/tyrosine transport system substrate-binding protein
MFGGAAMWPLAARAQQSSRKMPVVGVLWHGANEKEEAIYLGALRLGLKDIGYVEGETVRLENRFAAEQYDRYNSLADELVRLDVDVLIAVTRPAALAAQRATKTIPIVFILVPDPIGSGLVATLARPGGNITGLSELGVGLSAKRIELLKEVCPRFSRVALLVNPGDADTARRTIEESRAAASLLGATVQPVEARNPQELEHALAAVIDDRPDAIILMPDGLFFSEREKLAEWAKTHGLPTMMFTGEMTKSGGLMSYSANITALFRRAPVFVDRLLKGSAPADLPVELPTRYELVVNLKTAKALGIDIPATVLAAADEVIE